MQWLLAMNGVSVTLGQLQFAFVFAAGEGVRQVLVEVRAAATGALVFAGAAHLELGHYGHATRLREIRPEGYS